jgi:hypothetical protein
MHGNIFLFTNPKVGEKEIRTFIRFVFDADSIARLSSPATRSGHL